MLENQSMISKVINSSKIDDWRAVLDKFQRVDVCQTPEYHTTYAKRMKGSTPLMWCFEEGAEYFAYPFLLTPAVITDEDGKEHDTGYKDISAIYGYSGPLSTTKDAAFLQRAWAAFGQYCADEKVIAEFLRFSIYASTKENAHPNTEILKNRPQATTHMPRTDEELFAALGKKTRNMIRKAGKEGLVARELDLAENIAAFRALYDETMRRNEAPDFFMYTDEYYHDLLKLPEGGVRLFASFDGDMMVAASMALVHEKGALYHLGAGLTEYMKLGASNASMFEMSKALLNSGVEFLLVGGGRTTAEDDPLFRFKKSNAIGVDDYYIGKRVIDSEGYGRVIDIWRDIYGESPNTQNIIFYR